jgi:hypothetical protein
MEAEPTTEARAWGEYLSWTRGAAEGQYEITEERAWHRLERALLPLRLRPWLSPPPSSCTDLVPADLDMGGGGATATDSNP